MAYALSTSEAMQFLEGVLEMQSPMESLSRDRVGFLPNVIAAFQSKIAFQSVTAIATPKPERRGLTFPEIKADMMSRRGGLCFELNSFMKVLLETLGFEVYHVACTIFGKPNNHLSTVVKNLRQPGDLHLVEVGCGQPTFKPISLDFDKESPLYEASYRVSRFVRDADGGFRWLHKLYEHYEGPPEKVVDGWFTYMEFDLKRRDIEFFAPYIENVHTVESGPEALTHFLVRLKTVDYRNGRLLAISGTTIKEEDPSGKVTKTYLASPQELLEAFKVHFPQLPTETVQQAIQTIKFNLQFQK